jgi:putative sterol carrier protein
MAIAFGSPAWAEALRAEINRSSEYRNAAAKWGDGFNGNVLLVFEPDGALPRRHALLVEHAKGSCQGASFVDDPEDARAGFALRGTFTVWRDILERRTMAATAMLTGKLKVVGDKMTLLKHTAAHRSLIGCAAALDTEYPAA